MNNLLNKSLVQILNETININKIINNHYFINNYFVFV